MTPTLIETEAFVRRLFFGVVDKAGEPYVEHCVRVMEGLPAAATDDERHAALLHDVLEDTDLTARDLHLSGYSERTVWLVQRLTKWKGADYGAYVAAITASRDAGLIAIKRADLKDNSDPARLALLPARERERLAAKYASAREILEAWK